MELGKSGKKLICIYDWICTFAIQKTNTHSPYLSIDFTNSVDVFAIHKFLSEMVLCGKGAGEYSAGAFVHDATANTSNGNATGFLDILGSNYAQLNNQEVEARLKSSNIVLPNEKVEMAFKCGRDSFILTSLRVMKIDVQGITGKKGECPLFCQHQI